MDQWDALKRLENNLKNYYAANVAAARVRYETGAAEIVLWLKRLITPEAEYFEDPAVAPSTAN